MNDNDIEPKIKDNSNILSNYNLSKILESALVIAVVTAMFYFFGWAYTDGFLHRIGLSSRLIEFSTTYYIKDSYLGVFFAILLYGVSYHLTKDVKNLTTKVFLRNIFILILGLFFFFLAFNGGIKELFWFLIIFGFILIVVYISISVKQFELLPNSLKGKITLGLLILFLSSVIAWIIGHYHAEQAIEGKSVGVPQIQLKAKQDIPQMNSESKYILLFHNDNKYFITKQEFVAPESPVVFVIPDDEVEFVILNKLSQGN